MQHLVPAPAAPEPTLTALVVPVPAAEPLVGEHRRRLDGSSSWGVPAHVTVLFPFVEPSGVDDGVLAAVGAAVAATPAFDCTFAAVRWFGDDVLWLAPEPDQPFRDLTSRVWRAFPEHPPYGGAHGDHVPHLTVGERRVGGLPGLRDAERALAGGPAVQARVDRVLLVAGAEAPRSWRTVRAFPLGGASAPGAA